MTSNNEALVDAGSVRAEFGGKAAVTLHRWVAKGLLPPPIKINGRNYWRRSEIDAVKSHLAKLL